MDKDNEKKKALTKKQMLKNKNKEKDEYEAKKKPVRQKRIRRKGKVRKWCEVLKLLHEMRFFLEDATVPTFITTLFGVLR